jgi:hypothetical protein
VDRAEAKLSKMREAPVTMRPRIEIAIVDGGMFYGRGPENDSCGHLDEIEPWSKMPTHLNAAIEEVE